MSNGLSNLELAELYERYGHLMLRRIRAVLHDDQLAEDVLQTVFLKLMKHGASLREAESQLAWLYRTVDRCCFDLLRRRRLEQPTTASETASEPRALAVMEERNVLDMLWGKLDAHDRAVALLLYNDGLTQEEASRRLGCSRQSVGKRASAIRLLADRLARELELAK